MFLNVKKLGTPKRKFQNYFDPKYNIFLDVCLSLLFLCRELFSLNFSTLLFLTVEQQQRNTFLLLDM